VTVGGSGGRNVAQADCRDQSAIRLPDLAPTRENSVHPSHHRSSTAVAATSNRRVRTSSGIDSLASNRAAGLTRTSLCSDCSDSRFAKDAMVSAPLDWAGLSGRNSASLSCRIRPALSGSRILTRPSARSSCASNRSPCQLTDQPGQLSRTRRSTSALGLPLQKSTLRAATSTCSPPVSTRPLVQSAESSAPHPADSAAATIASPIYRMSSQYRRSRFTPTAPEAKRMLAIVSLQSGFPSRNTSTTAARDSVAGSVLSESTAERGCPT
jgi:hypothetical protein